MIKTLQGYLLEMLNENCVPLNNTAYTWHTLQPNATIFLTPLLKSRKTRLGHIPLC